MLRSRLTGGPPAFPARDIDLVAALALVGRIAEEAREASRDAVVAWLVRRGAEVGAGVPEEAAAADEREEMERLRLRSDRLETACAMLARVCEDA